MKRTSAVGYGAERWDEIRDTWTAWWAGELPRPLVVAEVWSDPAHPSKAPKLTAQLPPDMPVEQVLDIYEQELARTYFCGDAVPKFYLNFGPGIAAGFMGARVHVAPDTVWFDAQTPEDLARQRFRYDPDNAWWRRIRDLTAAATARWGGRVCVAHTDLGGNLDILASFRTTERLLMDLCDSPHEVEWRVRDVTALWLRYYDELDTIVRPPDGRGTAPWAPIWSPGRCYMLQCDFSFMISPRMFEQFVMPDLDACCRRLDHAFYHMDGKGQLPHLDLLLSIPTLRGIQWVPGAGQPSAEEWMDVLKRIRDAGKLCQLYLQPEGAFKIVRALGGRGFLFYVFMDDPTPAKFVELRRALAQASIDR